MHAVHSSVFTRRASILVLSTFSLVFCAGLLTGCGSQMMAGPPPPVGNTQVVVLFTSTANDQLTLFNAFVTSIVLTNQAGGVTTLFSSPQPIGLGVEWMHLNGASEPIVTVAVPQGTYISAQVTVADCSFTTVTFTNSTLLTSTDAQGTCGQGTGMTTVNLAAPITITGSVVGLSFDLQVAQSFTESGPGTNQTYTISPVFTLTPVSISPQPSNETNGKITGLDAQVSALNATSNNFTALTTDGVTLTVKSDASTVYQGLAGLSSLATNELVNLDVAIQSDGSLLATRVEVDDATAPVAAVGTYLFPGTVSGQVITLSQERNGCQALGAPFCGELFEDDNTTAFRTSGQFSNVASLPFSATFDSSTMVPGENISIFYPGTFDVQSFQNATTVTLAPQTLNGTVTAVSNQNGFAVYTVSLASYNLFPTLQMFNTLGPHLTDPTTLVVYVDTSAQMLNSGMIQVGSLLRFRGLVFNDNGALRMDAGQIYDGVPD
jgi:hypothetical protein